MSQAAVWSFIWTGTQTLVLSMSAAAHCHHWLLLTVCVDVCARQVHFSSKSQLWRSEVFRWQTTWRTWSNTLWLQRLDRFLHMFAFFCNEWM